MKTSLSFAMLALLVGSARANSKLSPGSPPPALDVKTWYKGAPVSAFDQSKTYVVEFWATWCGPCIESIPHLTALAKGNPDVTFIGVSIWEDDDGKNIREFIAKMGDKMDYHVGYSGNQTGMAQSWMAAAGQNGIPTAFVIKNNRIDWIGHPMELAAPLGQIKAGTFDEAKFKTEFAKKQAIHEAQAAVERELSSCVALYEKGDKAKAKVHLATILKNHPDSAESVEAIRFKWLATDDFTAWESQAKAMATSKNPQQVHRLCSFALAEASGNHPKPEMARKAIQIALQGPGGADVLVLLYAATVYEATKDDQLALDSIEALLKAIPQSPYKDQTELITQMEAKAKALQARIHPVAGG